MMSCPSCGGRAKSLLGWFGTVNPFAIRCSACGAGLKLTTASWVLVTLLFVGFLVGVTAVGSSADATALLAAVFGFALVGECASWLVVRFEPSGGDLPPAAPPNRDAAAALRPAVLLLYAMAVVPSVLGVTSWALTSSFEDLALGLAYAVLFALVARGLATGMRAAWLTAVTFSALLALMLAVLVIVFGEQVLTAGFLDGMQERGQSVWRVAMIASAAVLGTAAFPTLMSRAVRGAIGR